MLVVNIQSLMPKIIMVFLIGKQLCLWTLAKPLVNIHMSIYKKFPLRPRWPFMLQYFYISIFFLDLSSKKITNLPNLIVCYFRRPYCTYVHCLPNCFGHISQGVGPMLSSLSCWRPNWGQARCLLPRTMGPNFLMPYFINVKIYFLFFKIVI